MVPNGWSEIKLGSFMQFKNGVNADKDQYGSGYKFVNVMDVFRNDRLTEKNIQGKVNLSQKQLIENQLQHGDVLFNRTSETFDEIAMSAVYLDNSIATFGGFVIRGRCAKEFISPEYSVYAFQAKEIRSQAIRFGQGAVRANIGQKDLSKIKMSLPPLKEQEKIAKILSTWDKAISTTERLIDNSKQQKKALMQQLLTGRKRLHDDSGNPFEGEWKESTVGKVAELTAGGTPSTRHDEYWGGDIPWMNSGEVNLKKVYSVEGRITKLGLHKSSTKEIPENSVLIALAGQGKTRGTVAINRIKLCTNQSIAAIMPNPSQLVSDFLYFNLDNRYQELRGMSTGDGGRGGLNLSILKSIILRLPSLDEQQKIAAVLTNADKEIETLEQQLADLKQEKKALMQQLLTGKRRVKIHDKEVA